MPSVEKETKIAIEHGLVKDKDSSLVLEEHFRPNIPTTATPPPTGCWGKGHK